MVSEEYGQGMIPRSRSLRITAEAVVDTRSTATHGLAFGVPVGGTVALGCGRPRTEEEAFHVKRSDELQELWREYKRTNEVHLRNRLVEEYLPLVNYLAERIAERLPRSVGVDEVRSAGVLGLMDAVHGFDLSRGIKFETYCSVRIRGSILDELRSRDWAPRLVRSRVQKFAVAVRQLQAKFGRKPTHQEILKELSLSPDEFEALQRDTARLAIYSLNQGDDQDDEAIASSHYASLVDKRHPDPVDELQKQEATGVVMEELERKERQILRLYYFAGLTMKEIGGRLSLSESRVCQIHGQALERVRDELGARSHDLVN